MKSINIVIAIWLFVTITVFSIYTYAHFKLPVESTSEICEEFEQQLANANTGWQVIDSCGTTIEIYVFPEDYIPEDLDFDPCSICLTNTCSCQ